MRKLKVLDLFSGIGGFSLGLERTGGFETVAFCEIEKFPQKVLKKHWPNVPIYEDVRELTSDRLQSDGIFPNVITGGFPCQDISVAGIQKGIGEKTRSGLWSECARLVGELRPKFAVFENVTNLLNGSGGDWFKRVLWDLFKIGYDAEWYCIRASDVGMPHVRDRIWIIAYPLSKRRKIFLSDFLYKHFTKEFIEEKKATSLDSSRNLRARFRGEMDGEPPFVYGDNGFSRVVGGLAAGGNAVVPQIPELIGNAILESESENAT